MKDKGASATPKPALVSDQAPAGLDPVGFDPARGVPRQTLVRLGRDCLRHHAGAECNDEIVGMLRTAAKRVTGGNCTFADDDINILAELANRAVDAGLTEGLHPTVLSNIRYRRDSGSDPSGRKAEGFECEASQSGPAKTGHRPTPIVGQHSHGG